MADTQPSADIRHIHALPKIHVSLPKQANNLLCTVSLLHLRTLSNPTWGTRILSQELAQNLGRGSPVSFFRVDHWPLTAQGKLDRARLVWMADFGDGREL